MANSSMSIDRSQTATELVNSSIPVRGTTNWQSASGTIQNLDKYRTIIMKCCPHGTLQQSIAVNVDDLLAAKTIQGFNVSVYSYWSSGDLGMIGITGDGNYVVSAKTNTIAFDYMIYAIE